MHGFKERVFPCRRKHTPLQHPHLQLPLELSYIEIFMSKHAPFWLIVDDTQICPLDWEQRYRDANDPWPLTNCFVFTENEPKSNHPPSKFWTHYVNPMFYELAEPLWDLIWKDANLQEPVVASTIRISSFATLSYLEGYTGSVKFIFHGAHSVHSDAVGDYC